jgi:hypothetical protein
MTEPINWTVVDDALHAWIVSELSITAARVIWANQNLPQPAYPYVALLRSGTAEVGTLDETVTSTDLTQPAGEEIELLTTGPREFTLKVTAHVDVGTGAYNSDSQATALLTLAQSSLGKRSVLDALSVAGIAIIERLPVLDTSVVVNGEWNSQAAFDVRMRVTSEMTEQIGYINKTRLSSTFENAAASLDLDDFLIDASS